MSSSAPTPPEDGFPAGQTGDMRDVLLSPSSGTRPAAAPAGPWEPPTAEELQKLLPQYEITALLGRGGMGAVYKGRQIALDRPVAIKILSNQLDEADASFAERFKNEARALGKLSHPGIVGVYEFGEAQGGLLYIVMEFIDGTDVAKMIAKQGRLHTEHAMAITAHVCDALAYAHERGIIHRDIKPANIMVGYDGVVKVADFGLAKMTHTQNSGLTQSGMAMGTLHYMAPEALMLGSAVDHRADIYAVGVMLYQMLTGKIPQGLFELPSLQIPGLDPRYDSIIGKALREDRELRYPRVLDMRHDLDAILTQPVVKVEAAAAKPPAALETQARPQRPGGQPYRPPQPEVIVRTEKKSSPLLWVALIAMSGIAGWLVLNKDSGKSSEEPPSAPVSEAPVADDVNPSAITAGAPSATTSNSATATKEMPFVNSLGMKFVPVPITGGPTDGKRVLFSIWETRVQDYEAFISETKRPFPKPRFTLGADHPAVNVDWHNAVAFCEWLTERGHRTGQLSSKDGYRLPTDHEWSCAIGIGDRENAAASPRDKNERMPGVFPWGGSSAIPPTGAGNYAGAEFNGSPTWLAAAGWKDDFPFTAPVGSSRDDTGGLFDLGGNVWEWCQDWDDPVKGIKVLRGGRWNDPRPESQMSSSRHWLPPSAVSDSAGFRVVLQVSGDAPTTAGPLTTTGWIDLLALVDPEKDTMSGKWTRVPGGLHGEKLPEGKGAQYVQLPYEVPEEYDFRISMTHLEGNCEATQILSAAGRQFTWGTASGQSEKWAGFNMVNGKPMMLNSSGVKLPGRREVNRRYESLVEVRRDRVTGYVDGVKLVEWKTDYSDLSMDPAHTIPNPRALGIAIWWSKTVFHEIAVREVTGKGKRLREPGASPPAVEAVTVPTGDDLSQATKDKPFVNSLGMKFVPVPGTNILMCVHETRKADYASYAAGKAGLNGFWKSPTYDGTPVSFADDHPVCNVSWQDCRDFCEWLNHKEGRTYRLPTDREWSFAVGIGEREDASLSPHLLSDRLAGEFPWGSQWPPPAGAGNLGDTTMASKFPKRRPIPGYTDGFATTAPVMSFSPNPFGLHDLAGNVWEFCEDWYDGTQTKRVIRGLNFDDGGENSVRFLSSHRGWCPVGNRHSNFGFRVVLDTAARPVDKASVTPAVIAPPQTAEETGFMPLLDTTHTDGWQTVSKGSAGDVELADGVLTLKPNQNWPGYHWYVKQSFGDFTLRLQYKLGARSGNSGVPVRVELPSQMPRQHYEVDVSNSSNPMEASGAIMFIKPPTARAQKDDDWNDLEITADGQNYRILINGVVVNEFIGNKSTRGHIGLQIGVSTVQYRNIRIKELTPPVPPASVVSVTLPTGPTTWTDTKGRSITATFKAIASGNVLLDIAGKVTPVPLNTLSAESQKLARDCQQAAMTTTFPDKATKEVPFINTLGMKFVPVPGTKTLFCIHETRRQDYGAFAAANPGADSAWKNALESGVPVGNQEDHPVANVSWNEAQTFCAWLSTKEGRAYRLPTDREWSTAVGLANREPTGMTPEQLKLLPQNANHFPWGTTWPPPKDAGNFSDTTASAMLPPDVRASSIEGYTDGFATTAPVMSFTPNRLGLYDLGGNVFEMVQDLIEPTRTEYVVRGHSYAGGTRAALLSSNRGTCASHAQITRHGFRVVLSVAPATTAVPMPSPSAIVPPSPRAPSGTSTPATTKGTPFINTLGMKFVPVPGTKVLFSIWETRVRDYSVFARSNKVDDSWTNRQRNGIPVARDRDHPVVAVNWEEAQAFCRWLTDEETTAGKLTKGWLYRLPKDEEWSAAVGLTSEQGTTPSQKGARSQEHYPWGGAFPPPAAKIGNYADSSWHDAFPNDLWMNGYTDGFPTTAPVGSFPANLHGIHDLGGNVWEWCDDLLTPQVTKRVLRGGSWGNSSRDDLRSACRYFFGEPENRAHAYGFRCVLELPQP
jgi:formylglycine-generating enzyme required for sulfatase activity/serine/threonine protein kinase